MVRAVKRRRAAALLAALALPGCRRERRKTIAVIPKANSHYFWVSVQAGAMAAGKEFGVEVLWNGPATETDYSRQVQIIDSMIARRVDGIAVAANERKAIVPPVERAMAAGIPVTIFDSGLDTENYVSFVTTGNYEAGALGGRALGRLLGGRGKVAVIQNAPGSFSTLDRERGFEDALAREFPGVRVVARQFSMSDKAKAMAVAENFLSAHPDLDGLFASTELGSTGAALALKARGAAGRVKLMAFDSSETMIEDLKAGAIAGMVVQDPRRMGFEAVRTLVDKLNGKAPPRRIDLEARLVTKEDLNTPEIRRLLAPDLKEALR